ncbi:MAG: hypothetical protein VX730_08535 [Pseudomonadota bacterium]|nr:hypothetical protein [Pseudomonadota bacterium]
MCTQAILKDLIDPLKGEVALLFVTKFHCSGGKLVILSECAHGQDSAVFSIQDDIVSVDISCYPGDRMSMLEVLTKQDELYIATIEQELADKLIHQLAMAPRPNGMIVRNARKGS